MQACVIRDTTGVGDVAVLIPVWQPDEHLSDLVSKLLDFGFGAILIVNDGSDSKHEGVFHDLSRSQRVHVLRHPANLGRGRALKTGLAYFSRRFPEFSAVVTTDGDGQHRAEDVVSAAKLLRRDSPCIVLGSRRFANNDSYRSRFENTVTRTLFAVLTGRRVADTYSSLRAIPASVVPSILALEGEGYDYEMNVLTHAATSCGIIEVPVASNPLEGKRSPRLRNNEDAAKIYLALLRPCASSVIAAAIDFVVFAALFAASSNLLSSMIAGRATSLFNRALNRFVLKSKAGFNTSVMSSCALSGSLGVVAYFLIKLLTTTLGINPFAAKLLVETVLWMASFSIQRKLLFAFKKSEI